MDAILSTNRTSDYPIHELILHRWSPRALSGETISRQEIMALFEASRWAPSSYNNQPWRFIYAMRETENWEKFYNLLGDFNKGWAHNAAALVVVVSKNTFDFNGKPSRTHSFDAGAAWENLAIEAHALGLVAHAMEGFDYDRTATELGVSEDYSVEAMIAIGRPGKKENLTPELQEKENPSERKKLEEIVMEGRFDIRP